jgi:hypothetical protein
MIIHAATGGRLHLRGVLLARRKNKTAGGPGVVGEGRDRSALGPHRIGNLRIRAGRSGHDGYEEIAGRSLFLPMTSVARPAWRRVRIPPGPAAGQRPLPTRQASPGRASPAVELVPTLPHSTNVVLASRATIVPFIAVLTGPQRTITGNITAASTCAVPSRRR